MAMSTTRRHRGKLAPRVPRVMLPIKMSVDLRQRFKVAAAEEGTTYAGLIEQWLNERDRKVVNARRQQAHPLHIPSPKRVIGQSVAP